MSEVSKQLVLNPCLNHQLGVKCRGAIDFVIFRLFEKWAERKDMKVRRYFKA